MKRIIFLMVFISNVALGQISNEIQPESNSIDLTIGGLGLGVSLNYSAVFFSSKKYFTVASVGLGTMPALGGVSFPHKFTFNYGTNGNYVEFGLGGSYWIGSSNSSGYTEKIDSYNLSPIIGWRKHFRKGIVTRVFASPLIHVFGEYFYEDKAIVPYLGVSVGYGF